jgi:hypothetical protein
MQKLGKTWKSRLAVFCFITSFLYSTLAPAEEMKLIPPWTRMKDCKVTVEDTPGLHACYNFEGAQTLKKLDKDFQLNIRKLELLEEVNQDLRSAITNLELSLEKEQENAELLNVRLIEKQKKLEDTTAMYVSASQRDVFGGALPWVIVAIVVFAAAGFVGGYYAAK